MRKNDRKVCYLKTCVNGRYKLIVLILLRLQFLFGIVNGCLQQKIENMRRVFLIGFIVVLATTVMSSCEAIKNLPTNTTGGLFSLNGTWRLTSTSDNNALVGTTISVYPVVGNAVVKTISNNTYCVRENDPIWKSVKGNGAGGFTISALVNGCNGTVLYKDGTISIVTADKVTLTSRTAGNTELVQAWDRVKQ